MVIRDDEVSMIFTRDTFSQVGSRFDSESSGVALGG